MDTFIFFSISFCFILHEANNNRTFFFTGNCLILLYMSIHLKYRYTKSVKRWYLTAALFLNYFFLNYLYSINEESELRTNESVACVSCVQMQPNIFPGTDLTQLRNIVKGTACRGAESTTDLDRQMFFTWILRTAH